MQWEISNNLVEYKDALEIMEKKVSDIISAKAEEKMWLLEHPSLYTAGTSSDITELVDCKSIPVFKTGRGGKYTYHGPGQRIAYLMLDLKKRYKEPDIKRYISDLEDWLIRTLKNFAIKGEKRKDRVGIWVKKGREELKIAAIGIRIRKWVSYHGVAINLNPDLSFYKGIVPCGIRGYGVTSFADLGINCKMEELDKVLKKEFE